MTPLRFDVDFEAVPALRAADAVDKALAKMGDTASAAGKQFSTAMQGAQNSAQALNKGFTASMSAIAGPVKAAAATFAALGGASALLAKTLLDDGAKMEKLETQLRVLTGSAEAGTARFQELFRIGASTPFEVGDLVEADVILRSLGAHAEEVLPMVLDFAGAMGTDLQSAALDVGRAMQFGAGAVETLAGRALRAQVELRTGQDALKMSNKQFADEVKRTLTDTNGIFAGGTAMLSKTWSGAVSNLADEWTKFKKAVNDSGFFAGMKALLQATLAAFDANRAAINDVADMVGRVLLENVQRFITLLGGLRDGWTRFQLGVNAVGGLFDVAVAKAAGMVRVIAEGAVGIARMQEAITGLAPPLMGAAQALAQTAAVFEGGAKRGIAEAAAEGARLNEELGKGAAWASAINTSIDKAAYAARTFKVGDVESRAPQAMRAEVDEASLKKVQAAAKEFDALVQDAADAAAMIGASAADARRIAFEQELRDTTKQFDTLIAVRVAAGADALELERQKNAALANLTATFEAEQAELLAQQIEEANAARLAQEQAAAAARLAVLEQEAQRREAITRSVLDFTTSAAVSAANTLIASEEDKAAAIKAISAGMFADLLDQLARYFGVKAGAAAATGNFVQAGLFAAGSVVAATGASVVRGMAASSTEGGGGEVFHQGGVGVMPGDVVQTGETMAVLNRGATRDMGLDEVGLRALNHRGGERQSGGVYRLRVGNAEIDLVEELAAIDARNNGGFTRRMRGQGRMAPGFRGAM